MKLEHVKPEDIEKRSFEILSAELDEMGISIPEETAMIVKRCIHTTADFEYASTLKFSEEAVNRIKELIREGACIVTDTNMALTGINKKELAKYNCEIRCYMAEEDVAAEAKERQVTRATVSMERAISTGKPTIFVVGNAPTALITLYEYYEKNIYVPSFIVGVPVGFVNVVAAKELILKSDIPHIINQGRKGGSNVAAAIINAVLYSMR